VIRVLKYQLPPDDEFELELPIETKILYVTVQRDIPCMWCEVDDRLPNEVRSFVVYGTGQPIPEMNLKYIATYTTHNVTYVFHLFEVLPGIRPSKAHLYEDR
jgi:hypothetical protein